MTYHAMRAQDGSEVAREDSEVCTAFCCDFADDVHESLVQYAVAISSNSCCNCMLSPSIVVVGHG